MASSAPLQYGCHVDSRLARWLRPRDDWQSALEDALPYRGISIAQRLADLDALCCMTAHFLDRLPPDQRARALAAEEPLSSEREADWRRLVEQRRARR